MKSSKHYKNVWNIKITTLNHTIRQNFIYLSKRYMTKVMDKITSREQNINFKSFFKFKSTYKKRTENTFSKWFSVPIYFDNYNQLFSRYFFFKVKPYPNVAMNSINVKIIIGTFVAAILKLNKSKNITAMIASTQNIDLDFFCCIPTTPL